MFIGSRVSCGTARTSRSATRVWRLATTLAVIATPVSPAGAAEAPDAAPMVELFVDVAADVRVENKTFRATCDGPCKLQVPAGYYTVTTPQVSKEILVDRTAHLSVTRGAPVARSVSLVVLVTGVLVAAAAVAVPLLVCTRGEPEIDEYGRQYTRPNPCRDIGDGAKVAWIAGGGAGLTLGIVGGIGLAISGPRLTLSF